MLLQSVSFHFISHVSLSYSGQWVSLDYMNILFRSVDYLFHGPRQNMKTKVNLIQWTSSSPKRKDILFSLKFRFSYFPNCFQFPCFKYCVEILYYLPFCNWMLACRCPHYQFIIINAVFEINMNYQYKTEYKIQNTQSFDTVNNIQTILFVHFLTF